MVFAYDAFISHSSGDEVRIRELYHALRALGLRVFDDRILEPGDSLYRSLRNALDSSEFVLFCISRASVVSGWVELEVGTTLAAQISEKRKKIIPILLDDTPPPSLLADLVWLDWRASTTEEVAAKINSAISASRASSENFSLYPYDVTRLVDTTLSLFAGERAAPNFCWSIVSGPSSAGKDVLSYIVVDRLQQQYGLMFLRKFTTRPRRPSEPNYVEQVNDAEFEKRYRNGKLMCPFRKRTFRYGFDADQFRQALREGTPLISVFTEFRLVPALVKAMSSAGIRTRAFLIKTEKADVLRRVLFRNLEPIEVDARTRSIERDYEEMQRRTSLVGEYFVIPNGDADSFSSASTLLTEEVRSLIECTADAVPATT